MEKRHEMGFRQISVPALTTNASAVDAVRASACMCASMCVCVVHCGIFRTLRWQFNVVPDLLPERLDWLFDGLTDRTCLDLFEAVRCIFALPSVDNGMGYK